MRYSAKQFAEKNDVSYPVAYGFLRFLSEKGLVKTDTVKNVRGRGTVFFDLPENLVIKTTTNDIKEPVTHHQV